MEEKEKKRKGRNHHLLFGYHMEGNRKVYLLSPLFFPLLPFPPTMLSKQSFNHLWTLNSLGKLFDHKITIEQHLCELSNGSKPARMSLVIISLPRTDPNKLYLNKVWIIVNNWIFFKSYGAGGIPCATVQLLYLPSSIRFGYMKHVPHWFYSSESYLQLYKFYSISVSLSESELLELLTNINKSTLLLRSYCCNF